MKKDRRRRRSRSDMNEEKKQDKVNIQKKRRQGKYYDLKKAKK